MEFSETKLLQSEQLAILRELYALKASSFTAPAPPSPSETVASVSSADIASSTGAPEAGPASDFKPVKKSLSLVSADGRTVLFGA